MPKYALNVAVDILGSLWYVQIRSEEEEPRLSETDGFTDWTTRSICVADVPDECDCTLGDPLEYIKKVLRHEVIHAFMFESGLAESWHHKELGQEEMTVDWFAIQLPKIQEVVDQLYNHLQKGDEVMNV